MTDNKKSSPSGGRKSAGKTTTEKIISLNRQAGFQYHIEKKIEVGIVLTGSEVKSCREGRVQLVDSYAGFERGEVFLYKIHIAEYKQSGPHFNHEPARKRKLLLHKREIKNLGALVEQQGYTLVPLKFYFKAGKVKVEIGLCKGKTKGDKRESIKNRETNRDLQAQNRRSQRHR